MCLPEGNGQERSLDVPSLTVGYNAVEVPLSNGKTAVKCAISSLNSGQTHCTSSAAVLVHLTPVISWNSHDPTP